MSCTLGQDAGGNRYFACRRSEFKTALHLKEDDKPMPCSHAYPKGTRVKHAVYGIGIVAKHSETHIWIDFIEQFVVQYVKLEILQ